MIITMKWIFDMKTAAMAQRDTDYSILETNLQSGEAEQLLSEIKRMVILAQYEAKLQILNSLKNTI